MKALLRIAAACVVYCIHLAGAQQPANPPAAEKSGTEKVDLDASVDEKVRELDISESELATVLKNLSPDLPEPAKRHAVVFRELAQRNFQTLGFSGLSDPTKFREADRVMSRALQRVEKTGPATAKAIEKGERVLRFLRILHASMNRQLDPEPVNEWLGVATVPIPADAGEQQRKNIADPSATAARLGDLLAVYDETIGLKKHATDGPRRTAPIYTSPLAQLQVYAGDSTVAAKESLTDRLARDYVQHKGDYFFLAEEESPPPKVLVQYRNPKLDPVASIPLSPRDTSAGLDWKGKITLRPAEVRTHDGRRPAGGKWKTDPAKPAITFTLSRERGVYYVDAVETEGNYRPVELVTVAASVVKALADK